MLKYRIVMIVLALPMALFSQEIVIKANYSIRDFNIEKDSLYYLEHTELNLTDLKSNKTISYFVGGFGLEFYQLNDSELLTVANEMVKNVSSFRFYNKKTNRITDSFFYKNGKVIDFVKIPELNVFAFSATNKKIIFINFDDRKNLRKIIEIKINALSRKLIYKNQELWYCTDNGEIFKYSLVNYQQQVICKTDKIITDFIVMDDNLVYSTIDGAIVKSDLKSKSEQKLKLKDDFILTSLKFKDDLFFGSWKGHIYVINLKDFKISQELDYHQAPVLKILHDKDSIFYSSSIDKTIKKWTLK